MAIKIIERREPVAVVFRCICTNCTSVLEYVASDMQWCDAMGTYFIKCPVCKVEIEHNKKNRVNS